MKIMPSRLIRQLAAPAIVGAMILPAAAAPGTWQEPSAGWEAVYDASGNLLPWELPGTGTDQTWDNQIPRDPSTPGFASTDPNVANSAGKVTDEVSGNLVMEMNTTGAGNAIAGLNTPPGSGTNADLLTVDLKFRLFSDLDPATAYADLPTAFPLLLTIVRPPTSDQLAGNAGLDEQFWQLRLRRQNVFALGANSSGGNQNQSGTTRLSNEWHELRFVADVNTGNASIYLDGSDTPDITDLFPRTTDLSDPLLTDNNIYFGAAGSGIGGVGSVEYIKITNSELVSVVPEPASMTLLAFGSLILAARIRG